MIKKVKIEYICKNKVEVFSEQMIINDMINGEAIAEVLISNQKINMKYDKEFDALLVMLLMLSLRRDAECKEIRWANNQIKKIWPDMII